VEKNFKKIIIYLIFFFPFYLFLNETLRGETSKGLHNPLVLQDIYDSYSPGLHMEFLEDAKRTISIEEILKDKNRYSKKLTWVHSKKEILSFGFTNSAYWLRISIRDISKEKKLWSLVFTYPILDKIELYSPSGKSGYNKRVGGDSFPFKEREVLYRSNIFRLNELSKDVKTYYIRVTSSSSLNLTMELLSSTALEEKISDEQFFLGIYYGLVIVMILYNLFLYVSIKDKSYFLYGIWIITYGISQGSVNGLTFQYLWPTSTWWANINIPFFIFMNCIFILLLSREFLKIKKHSVLLELVFLNISYVLIIFLALCFFLPYSIVIQIATVVAIILTILCIFAGILSQIKGFRAARFYNIAFFAFFTGTIIMSMKSLGLLPSNNVTNWAQQIGSSLVILLLSLALGDRIRIINQEKKLAQYKNREAQEKFQLLVNNTNDIIFTLDKNLNFIFINSAVKAHLKTLPEKYISKNFFDIIYDSSSTISLAKNPIHEKIDLFLQNKETITFKIDFKIQVSKEPKEMQVTLEYITDNGKDEIFGRATAIHEDALIKNFNSEQQQFTIENLLINSEDISYKITQNINKYMEPKEVTSLRLALREIIINAIEHGNLNITFEEKTAALLEDNYFNLLGSRRLDPRYKDRRVIIRYSINSEQAEYTIIDEGKGFDHSKFIIDAGSKANEENLAHGRGIAMVIEIFDKFHYNERGNQVTLIKYFNPIVESTL